MLTFLKLANKSAQSTLFYSPAQTRHQRLIIVQIVNRIQLRTQHFPAFIEVVQIGATEILAGIATTLFIQRSSIIAKATIATSTVQQR